MEADRIARGTVLPSKSGVNTEFPDVSRFNLFTRALLD